MTHLKQCHKSAWNKEKTVFFHEKRREIGKKQEKKSRLCTKGNSSEDASYLEESGVWKLTKKEEGKEDFRKATMSSRGARYNKKRRAFGKEDTERLNRPLTLRVKLTLVARESQEETTTKTEGVKKGINHFSSNQGGVSHR